MTQTTIRIMPENEGLRLIPAGHVNTLSELSMQHPLWIVMLRHAGCLFCRLHLSQLGSEHAKITQRGDRLVIVSASSTEEMSPLLSRYSLRDALLVTDPAGLLYKYYALRRLELAGLKYGARDLSAALKDLAIVRHGCSLQPADLKQLHGVAVIYKSTLQSLRRAKYMSEPLNLTPICLDR